MIFNGKGKRSGESIAALERELAMAQAQRTKLRELLAAAEAALNGAIAARRASLLESDGEVVGDSGDIVRRRSDRDTVVDALAEIEERISAIEARLAQAQEQAARDTAISELTPHTAELEKGIAALAGLAKTLAPVAGEVCKRTPHGNAVFSQNLGDLFINIGTELGNILANARQHIGQLQVGGARAVVVPAPTPVPAPPPAIERIDVLLICDSCWREGDQVVSAPKWSIRPLPIEIVARVERLGWVFRRESEVLQKLLETNQVSGGWHSPDPRGCVDLLTIAKRPPPGSLGRSLGKPADRDEATTLPTIGETVEGVATASIP